MINFSKTNWLTIVLIVTVCATGFFAYQWWQVKGELVKKIEENESLIKQVDKLQKEIEELKVAEGEIIKKVEKVTDEIIEWKTYRNKVSGFEIKYPKDWKIDIIDPQHSIDFTKETPQEKIRFAIGINLYGEFSAGPFSRCIFKGKEITIKRTKFYPTIFSDLRNELPNPTEEECNISVLGDTHTVYLEMCFDENLEYIDDRCPICPDSPKCPKWKKEGYWGNYYQFYFHCEGEKWQGREGMQRCSQLFNQIMATFKFIN